MIIVKAAPQNDEDALSPRVDRRIVYLLNSAQRRLQRWIQGQTADTGATAAQFGLLFFLGQNDGALMGEASEALDLTPSAMSGLVDRMAGARLIERRSNSVDGRAWHLWPTRIGHVALDQTKAALVELDKLLTKGFAEKEIDVIARWLSSFQKNFP